MKNKIFYLFLPMIGLFLFACGDRQQQSIGPEQLAPTIVAEEKWTAVDNNIVALEERIIQLEQKYQIQLSINDAMTNIVLDEEKNEGEMLVELEEKLDQLIHEISQLEQEQ